MDNSNFNKTLDELSHEVILLESATQKVSGRLQTMCRQLEAAKMKILKRRLEKRRASLAHQAGLNLIARDRSKLGISLGAAIAGMILGGALGADKLSALSIGISSFDAAVQGLDKTTWAVSLGKDLTVLPKNSITAGKIWVTWKSLKSALAQLEREAFQGVALGNLDSVISRLQARKELVYLHSWVPKTTWVKVKEL